MRKNEHPRCGCSACRHAAGTKTGQYVHRQVNRAIRHRTRQALNKDPMGFDLNIIVSTPRNG